MTLISDATSGWAGWALAHPEFVSSVNPITTRGADYARHITTIKSHSIPYACIITRGLYAIYPIFGSKIRGL